MPFAETAEMRPTAPEQELVSAAHFKRPEKATAAPLGGETSHHSECLDGKHCGESGLPDKKECQPEVKGQDEGAASGEVRTENSTRLDGTGGERPGLLDATAVGPDVTRVERPGLLDATNVGRIGCLEEKREARGGTPHPIRIDYDALSTASEDER